MSILERAAGKGSAPEASFDGYSDSTNDTSRAAKQHTDDLAAGQPRAAGSDKPDIKEKVTEQRLQRGLRVVIESWMASRSDLISITSCAKERRCSAESVLNRGRDS